MSTETSSPALDGQEDANGGRLPTPPDAIRATARFLMDSGPPITFTRDQAERFKVASVDSSVVPNWPNIDKAIEDLTRTFQTKNVVGAVGKNFEHRTKLCAVDIDGDEAYAKFMTYDLPKTFTVRTGGGGWHLGYFAPKDCPDPKIEFPEGGAAPRLSDKGYFLLPGSWHAEAKEFYTVQADRQTVMLPQEIYDAIRADSNKARERGKKTMQSLGPDTKIPHGDADNRIYEILGYQRHVGMPQSSAYALASDIARNHLERPASEDWIETKLRDMVERLWRDGDGADILDQYALPDIAPPPRPVTRQPSLTEDGMAEHFVRTHGCNFRYFLEQKAWIVYRDGRWHEKKGTHAARKAYENLHRNLYADYAEALPDGDPYKEPAEKFSNQRAMRTPRDNALNIAESRLLVEAAELDRNPNLLAVGNGVLDLTTLKLREGRPEDYITVGSPVAYMPGAKSADLDRYLVTTFTDDALRAYMQRFCGLCLTGLTNEERLWIWHGAGRNGKGTLTSLMEAMLGDELYAAINFATLASDKYISGSAASPDVARLRGKRLVVATEKHSQRMIDEERIKKLTGGDSITARHLNKEEMQFHAQFKLVLTVNERPHMNVVDDAIRERVVLVPFTSRFVREDGTVDLTLKDRLREKEGLEAALAWAVEGLRAYRAEGLGSCEAIDRETAAYMAEMNPLVDFVARYFEQDERLTCTGADIAAQYQDYLMETAEPRLGTTDFSDALRALGFTSRRLKAGIEWRGLAPKGATL